MFFQLIIYFDLLPEDTIRRQSLLSGSSGAQASITLLLSRLLAPADGLGGFRKDFSVWPRASRVKVGTA